jgi:flavodoxin
MRKRGIRDEISVDFVSIHQKNTEKIANVLARVLDAPIKTPQQTNPEELQEYDLIGFGSGIYGAKHHESLLELADKLPQVTNKHAFIFSTSALTNEAKSLKITHHLERNCNQKVT